MPFQPWWTLGDVLWLRVGGCHSLSLERDVVEATNQDGNMKYDRRLCIMTSRASREAKGSQVLERGRYILITTFVLHLHTNFHGSRQSIRGRIVSVWG